MEIVSGRRMAVAALLVFGLFAGLEYQRRVVEEETRRDLARMQAETDALLEAGAEFERLVQVVEAALRARDVGAARDGFREVQDFSETHGSRSRWAARIQFLGDRVGYLEDAPGTSGAPLGPGEPVGETEEDREEEDDDEGEWEVLSDPAALEEWEDEDVLRARLAREFALVGRERVPTETDDVYELRDEVTELAGELAARHVEAGNPAAGTKLLLELAALRDPGPYSWGFDRRRPLAGHVELMSQGVGPPFEAVAQRVEEILAAHGKGHPMELFDRHDALMTRPTEGGDDQTWGPLPGAEALLEERLATGRELHGAMMEATPEPPRFPAEVLRDLREDARERMVEAALELARFVVPDREESYTRGLTAEGIAARERALAILERAAEEWGEPGGDRFCETLLGLLEEAARAAARLPEGHPGAEVPTRLGALAMATLARRTDKGDDDGQTERDFLEVVAKYLSARIPGSEDPGRAKQAAIAAYRAVVENWDRMAAARRARNPSFDPEAEFHDGYRVEEARRLLAHLREDP